MILLAVALTLAVPAPRPLPRHLPAAERPIRSVPLFKVEEAQARTSVALTVAGTTAAFSLSFGKDYAAYLTATADSVTVSLPWDGLESGAAAGPLKISRSGDDIVVCSSAEECRSLSFRSLLEAAYASAFALELPEVRYALLLSPDRRWLNLLRRDGGGRFYIACHAFARLQRETVWLAAVNDVMYGAKSRDGLLTIVSKPLPPAVSAI